VPGSSRVAAIVFAEDVKMVEVFIAPRKENLEHVVEVRQSRVAVDQKAPPDERTNVSEDDAQLVDHWGWLVVFHGQSVRCHPFDCKGSPRNLALSQRIIDRRLSDKTDAHETLDPHDDLLLEIDPDARECP
jgi:hypothetical protein